MVFSSIEFLFLFLPVVVVGYYLLPRVARNGWLLLASLVFYAWGEPFFVLVMLLSIAFNYALALCISRFRKRGRASWGRWTFAFAILGNLALLGGYKYLNFATATLRAWFPVLQGAIPQTSVLLPIGISFFTFQEMSYVIDVSRGEPAQRNPFRLALYIALFPQLIAGPIVRYSEIREQLVVRRETWKGFADGFFRFLVGLNKKVLLANAIAPVSDALLESPSPGPGLAWLGMVAFSLQMYFDFGGYSDMAIGLGRMFGFRFPENFRYPYVAATIADFWRRWHISLSTWFRDYVYYPLGGSRVGRCRLVFNILVVWTLVGVWHGADWAFVVWGFAWGLLLFGEKFLGIEKRLRGRSFLRWPYQAFTLFVILALAVFIRADGLTGTGTILRGLWGGTAAEPALAGYLLKCNLFVLVVATIVSTPFLRDVMLKSVRRAPPARRTVGCVVGAVRPGRTFRVRPSDGRLQSFSLFQLLTMSMKASVAIRIFCATMAFASGMVVSASVWCEYAQTRNVQEGVPFRKKFVSAYGMYCRLTGARECNGCVKLLKSGQLMLPTIKRRDMAEEALKTVAFSEFCRSNGVQYLYVQLPKKLDMRKTMLPPGVKDVAYENADDLLRRLADAGVATEDWRLRFAGSAERVAANFYASDTHWNNPTSLRAARALVQSLARLGGADDSAGGRAENLLMLKSWKREEVPRYFFGSLAKRTGRHFTEASDVTFLLPKFETKLTLKLPELKREESGSFAEVAVPAYFRMKSGRKGLPFSAQYAAGDERFVRLTNACAPLDKKILLLGDSFSRSVRTYLWVAVREIVAIDLRQYDPPFNVARLVLDERPDIVVQMPTAASLTADALAGEKRGHPAAFDYGL